ncbi:acylphosphatase [Aurantimonas sp. A2-1-M11]|uniref:acylphosphatase n=1 Tax=Aurantimonas sp. A2-1-M11 TaxID=3113712 RepID=UPI002F92376E
MNSSVHVTIGGRVQGVGYRAWCRDEAVRRGLSGWVRNRASGEVEAAIIGDAEIVDEFLAALWTGPRAASVSTVDVVASDEAPDGAFSVRATV